MLAEKMKKAFNSIDKTAKIKTPVKEIKKVQVVAGWDVFCDNEHNAFDTIKEAIKKSNFNPIKIKYIGNFTSNETEQILAIIKNMFKNGELKKYGVTENTLKEALPKIANQIAKNT